MIVNYDTGDSCERAQVLTGHFSGAERQRRRHSRFHDGSRYAHRCLQKEQCVHDSLARTGFDVDATKRSVSSTPIIDVDFFGPNRFTAKSRLQIHRMKLQPLSDCGVEGARNILIFVLTSSKHSS